MTLPIHASPVEATGLAATRLADLDFGVLTPGEGSGECVLAAGGGRTASGGIGLCGSHAHPAQFELQGPASAPFTVQIDPDPAGFRHGRELYQLTGFHIPVPDQGRVFDGSGRAIVLLGATLHVPGNAAPCTLPPVPLRLTVHCARHAPATASFTLRGRIRAALRARESVAMTFGRLVTPSVDSRVRLEPGGGLVPVDGGPLLALGGQARTASFALTGEPDARFSVTLPVSMTLHGPQGTLDVEDFRSDAEAGQGVLTAGAATVQVGATLRVKANQAPGLYRGTYLVTFSYD